MKTAKVISMKNITQRYAKRISAPLIPVAIAFLIGALFLLFSGQNPLAAYKALFEGALVGQGNLLNTLFSATPLLFTGLATAIAFRANIFNMGVEGQLYMGAFAAAYVGFTFSGLPPVIHVLLCLAAALLAGALFALVPGILKGYLGVNEMVVTIMLNYVAILFTGYLASFTFKAKGAGFSATEMINKSAELPRFTKLSQLNVGFIVAVVVVMLVYVLFKKMKLGYEINAIGQNTSFAEAVGMNVARKTVLIMVISGMIGGLAGAGEVLGVHHRFISNFSPGYGWDGMAIALLGANSPIGVLVAALFFGILKSGGSSMELIEGVPRSLINVIQGLIIFFLAVDFSVRRFDLVRKIRAKFRRTKEEVR